MYVGIDVGGTKALALLVDAERADGAVLDRSLASSAGTADELADTLAELATALIERSDAEVTAVGLGVAGLAHRSGTVRYSPNLPSLIEYPLADEVGDRLGLPVVLGNDATVATLAEWRLGAGRAVDDLVLVTIGTGIGVGLVSGGRLLQGVNGFAGEAGHAVIDRDGPEHLTGERGPWEYFASGSALGRLGREAAAGGRFPAGTARAGSADAVTGHDVTAALAAGDPDAITIFDGFCRDVALGVANLVLTLDPARVVLGGGLVEIGEPLREGVSRWLADLLVGADHRPAVDLRLAELGTDAGAIGAALLVAAD